MVRLVFEDVESLTMKDVSEDLDDQVLISFAQHCPNLRILAISRCAKMTVEGFKRLFANPRLQIIDFHTTPESRIGLLEQNFFMQLIPYLGHIRSLNLFGQIELSDEILVAYFKSSSAKNLKSICLNNAPIGRPLLECLLDVNYHLLQRLSVV